MTHPRPGTGLAALVVGFLVGAAVLVLVLAFDENPARSFGAWRHGARFHEIGDGVLQLRANDCGPAALAHCLRRIGLEAPYPDPERSIRLGPRGCALEALAGEARRRGVAVRTGRRILSELRPPAILFLRRGHFVVYEGRSGRGRVLVHDPGLGRISYSEGALRRRWTGHALVFPEGSAIF